MNVLAVLVQATFYKMPIKNENLEHDSPTPNLSDDRARAENRRARVMDEFVAQSSKYDTPRSLVGAHHYRVILQSQDMLPLGSMDFPRPKSYEGISGVVESLEYLAYNAINLKHFYFCVIVLSAAYAGIHMSAWNMTFPTSFELQAWRACCLFLAFGPVAAYLLGLFFAATPATLNSYHILNVLMVFHFWAKVFIVVESFISLRLVPIGVYWTPMWLQMIPHA